jgi:hypothetical protein
MSKLKYYVLHLVILVMLGIMNCHSVVYAADTKLVSTAATIEKVSDNQYLVPVYLLDNTGIMGFRIYLNYDSSVIRVDSITKGLLTAKGNFGSDLNLDEDANSGIVSVLWSGTENVVTDGSVMYVVVTVLDETQSNISITLDYSQEDTFDEKWNDVPLTCNDILISLAENTDVSEKYSEEMQEVIQNDEEKAYVEEAKETVTMYQDAKDIGEEKLKAAVVRTLKKYEVDSVTDIQDDQEDAFLESVKDDLAENENISRKQLEKMQLSQLVEQITITTDDLYDSRYDDVDNGETQIDSGNKIVLIVVMVLLVIVVLVLLLIFLWRRRKKHER